MLLGSISNTATSLCMDHTWSNDFLRKEVIQSQWAFTYSNLTTETLKQGVKYVQS